MLPPEVILASAWFSVAQGLVAGPQLGLSLPLVGSTYAVSYGGVTDANPVLAGMIASNPASRMSFRITYPPIEKAPNASTMLAQHPRVAVRIRCDLSLKICVEHFDVDVAFRFIVTPCSPDRDTACAVATFQDRRVRPHSVSSLRALAKQSICGRPPACKVGELLWIGSLASICPAC